MQGCYQLPPSYDVIIDSWTLSFHFYIFQICCFILTGISARSLAEALSINCGVRNWYLSNEAQYYGFYSFISGASQRMEWACFSGFLII